MSNCATFNCSLFSTFSVQEQRAARELLRILRIKGTIDEKSTKLPVSQNVRVVIEAIQSGCLLPESLAFIEETKKVRVKMISILDPDYPEGLLELSDPPFCLFLLSEDPHFLIQPTASNVCVVGSRSATTDAVALTQTLSAKATSAGLTIVSGLATGIDLAAHTGCLQSGMRGRAIAVLGNDASMCFPNSSSKIYKEILSNGGAIISEYAPGVKAMKHQFIARNRIMAALSQCTVVVQAKEKSGALHTARTALELGRDVAVLPWSLTVHAGRGSNMLLRDGAYPILCVDDLLALYPDLGRKDLAMDEHVERNDPSTEKVVKFLSQQSLVSASVLKEKFDLSEVDLIKLELERVITRSATHMISLV